MKLVAPNRRQISCCYFFSFCISLRRWVGKKRSLVWNIFSNCRGGLIEGSLRGTRSLQSADASQVPKIVRRRDINKKKKEQIFIYIKTKAISVCVRVAKLAQVTHVPQIMSIAATRWWMQSGRLHCSLASWIPISESPNPRILRSCCTLLQGGAWPKTKPKNNRAIS